MFASRHSASSRSVPSTSTAEGDLKKSIGLMAPPRDPGVLADWHKDLNMRFELGTLYTMIAGLLNVLAIWDAYGGPVVSEPGKQERGPPGDDKSKDKDKKAA